MILPEIFSPSLGIPFLAVYIFLLTPRRYSLKKTLGIFVSGAGFIAAVNIFSGMISKPYGNMGYLPVTVMIPIFLLVLTVSRYRDMRVSFSILTALLFCISGGILGEMIHYYIHNPALLFILKLFIYLGMTFYILFTYQKTIFRIMGQLHRKWFNLCLIPLSFCQAFYYLLSSFEPQESKSKMLPAVAFIIAAMLFSYLLIFLFFKHIQNQKQVEEDKRRLQIQLDNLKNQEHTIYESEKQTRIYHHDMRHYMQIVASLLENEYYEEASEVIHTLGSRIDKTIKERFCKNLTVNAAISSYIQQARSSNIEVTAEFDIPQKVETDELELAVALANALENAINACHNVPDGGIRQIRMMSRQAGQQMIIKISNTYAGEIFFDKKTGLPLSQREDHGIGSSSIYDFSKKYNAILDYSTDNGWFTLHILIPNKL